ncbi:MAG: FimB/Mfa2 family fimbrial subunit [Rikenellaceae bacterium]
MILYSLIFITLLLSGCVGEKSCGCHSELQLTFTYELNSQSVNLFETHIDKVTLFIFDGDDKYVGTYVEEGEHLINDYVMRIPLEEGSDYSVIAYGGDMVGYNSGELNQELGELSELVVGQSDISNFYTELESTLSDGEFLSADSEISHLYVGLAQGLVSTPSCGEVEVVELIKNTNDITVTVTGVDSYDSELDTYITSANGRHSYTNDSDAAFGTHKYTPTSSVSGDNSSEHSIRVMRLTTDSGEPLSVARWMTRSGDEGATTLVVSTGDDSTQSLYSDDLVELILSSPDYNSQEDLDREDSYSVEVALVNSVFVIISVNGWIVNEITPDF